MESSAKAFLHDSKVKKLKKKRDQYASWAEENLKTIQKALKERRVDHAEMYGTILNCLTAARTSSPIKLELPSMTPALLSTVLSNMALWIGNTDAAAHLAAEICSVK